jgi:putative FmdB family regulatory protein
MCPLYEYVCAECGPFEIFKGMNDPAPKRCPTCKGLDFGRVFSAGVAFVPAADQGWEQENGGAGHYCPQLGKRWIDPHTRTTLNPDAHTKSRSDAIDKFKRRGYDSIEKA